MSRDYWETRYQTHDMPWDKGEASPGVVDFLNQHPELPVGTVCVPGCGTGSDTLVWARRGFITHGFDLAPSAVALARQKAQAAGLTVGYHLADFLRDAPPQKFDWLFELTLFCAITVAEREAYVQAVKRWLKPGGYYLAVNYIECDPAGPPFPTTRAEQLQRWSPDFDLLADWVPRSYPNRENRERMFWWQRKAL